MTYKMNEKQFEAVLDLSDEDRYRHFISKVADWQKLWGIRTEEGWLIPVTPDGVEYFPFWPHPEYAQKVADKNWPGHHAEELDYEFLVASGLEDLAKDNIKIAVFPNMHWQCILVDARQLIEDFRIESKQYE